MHVTLQSWTRLFWLLALVYLVILPWAPFPGQFLVKAAPILLLLLPVAKSALSRRYKTMLTLAVIFSAAGDIFLALPLRDSLILGLGSFLTAHLFYVAVNARWMSWQPRRLFIAVPAVAAALIFLSSIMGAVAERGLLIPVVIYAAVLVAMTVVCCFAKESKRALMVGGLLFLLSDCILAYGIFVSASVMGSLAVMIAYYASEFLLVSANLDTSD